MSHAPNARRPSKPLIACAFALLACAFVHAPRGAEAQTPQAATAQGAQPADAVRLDVIFTDKSGRTVTDVRPEDVRVTENGAQQTVTRLAHEELPTTYALLVDNSRSMQGLTGAMAKAAAVAIVSNQKPGDEAAVIRFIDTKQIETLQEFTPDRDALLGALEKMFLGGGQTALLDATEYGVKKVAARAGAGDRRRAIILLTDGEDRSSFARQEELFKLLRREGVQVFAVAPVEQLSGEGGFIRKAPRAQAVRLMTEVAEESGGRAFFPKNEAELKAAVEEIALNLRAQYSVEYRPTKTARAGEFRKVQVKVTGGRRVFTRPGYFAGK